ncbi:MAG: hypothetical protein PF482_21150 [Desulfobacteraceae bacterium]|jgi:hypothetical protein|nr:hypothetical protein [Desulfobacteraceae bacterium]
MRSIRMRLSLKLFRLIILIMLPCFFAVACGGGGGDGGDGDENDDVSTTIGINGGVVEDTNGAKVSIPPGALSETYDISISSYQNNDELPQGVAPILEMRGAVKLEPDGLTFSQPVMVTVPVSEYMEPRTKFPLLYWNESEQIWEQTAFIATVADNGMSFFADVTHFSEYGGWAIEDLIYGGTIEQFENDFTAWFQNENNVMNDITAKNNECYKACGMFFLLEYEINGEKDEDSWTSGETETSDYSDAPLMMVDYTYDISKGHSLDGYVRITVTIHYKCTEPDFLIMADQAILSEGESTSVEASLSCAGVPLIGKDVTFDIQSGPGEINPGNTTTNSSGTATATFTAGNANSVVRAFYVGCEFGTSYTIERETPIAVAAGQYNLSITFDQTMVADDFSDYFTYSGTVPISVKNTDNVSGTADVEGSSTFVVTGHGTVDDCTTVTEGTVTFTFTGKLVTDDQGAQTLQLSQTPDFNSIKTTYCPDDPPFVNTFLSGGETSDFEIPAEDGYTFGSPFSYGGVTNNISYVLSVLK